MSKTGQEVRRGPWSEEEDLQLISCIKLIGDRRWDFIAKVSGLKRTGKSCRLRWVNYLNPELRREKMNEREEHLVMELHSKWGNRWSRIARELPGRTDNEIKNYWRTRLRKEARAKKQGGASSVVSLSESKGHSGVISTAAEEMEAGKTVVECCEQYNMDDIWRDIEESSQLTSKGMATSSYWWDMDSIWEMEEEQ